MQPARASEADSAMGYWTQTDLPFYYSLANTFPLATRWFSSCLGPTFPNRRFLIAGTANGLIDDRMSSCYDYPPAGTIFDLLTANSISWANYHNKPRWRTLSKSLFGRIGHGIGRRALPFLSGVLPNLKNFAIGDFQFSADLFPRGMLRTYNHAPPLENFFRAAASGTLPAVSFVDPDYGTFSEENPQDIQRGEGFAAQVIGSVMRGPGWPKTLLIWVYDEHGGYYDHVAPPAATAPDEILGTSLPERFPWLRRIRFLRHDLAQRGVRVAGKISDISGDTARMSTGSRPATASAASAEKFVPVPESSTTIGIRAGRSAVEDDTTGARANLADHNRGLAKRREPRERAGRACGRNADRHADAAVKRAMQLAFAEIARRA